MSEHQAISVLQQMQKSPIGVFDNPSQESFEFWHYHLSSIESVSVLLKGYMADQRVFCKVHSVFVSSSKALTFVQSEGDALKTFIREQWYEQVYRPRYYHKQSYGQVMEEPAIQLYKTSEKRDIRLCKNAINPNFPFLIASPDALVFSNHKLLKAVEIKTLRNLSHKPMNLCEFYRHSGRYHLKKEGLIYGQLQFTMLALNVEVADLVMYFPKLNSIEVIQVRSDRKYQESKMKSLYDKYIHFLMPYLMKKLQKI